jgi:hypothetical protein
VILKKPENNPKLWLVLVVLWMIVIFFLSTPYFSAQKTAAFFKTKINVRFCAHIFVYSVLGFLSSGAIRLNFSWKKKMLFTILFCLVFGILDEIHQHFEVQRSFRIVDLLSDGAGSLLGVAAYYFVYLRFLVGKLPRGKDMLGID